jgi:hypothetical protein
MKIPVICGDFAGQVLKPALRAAVLRQKREN